MPINGEMLEAIRNARGFSREHLAEVLSSTDRGDSISAKSIYRYEKGETRPNPRKAERLAAALKTTVEELARAPGEQAERDATLAAAGIRKVTVLLDDNARLSYRLAMYHYGLSFNEIVSAAPWMFQLLAEMSLAERRRRLEEANSAFEAAMATVPDHLPHAQFARSDFDNAYSDEKESIALRDIFGAKIAQSAFMDPPPHRDEINPFADFLKALANSVDSPELAPGDIELNYSDRLPDWPIFENWLQELTGGDSWARFAISNVRGCLEDMPEELDGPERLAERVEWLVARIPAELREKEQRRRIELKQALKGIEL